MRKTGQSRRATVLLMVVSVLALLFVVIITFITIARSDRATIRDLQKSNTIDAVVEYHRNRALELAIQDIRSPDGKFLSNRNSRFETIPGYSNTSYVSAVPAWSEGINNAVNSLAQLPNQVAAAWSEFGRLVLPAMTRLSPSALDKPTDVNSTTLLGLPTWPTPVWRLIPENELDNDPGGPTFEFEDLVRYARSPLFDATGDGLPDAWPDYQAAGIEFANSLAGTPVRIRGAGITVTENPSPNLLGGAPPSGRAWIQFLNNARYATSMTIYSHGGMVTIDAPTIQAGPNAYFQPWNRGFQTRMFNSFKNPNDASIYTWTTAERNGMFDGVAYSRESVEPLLRRRFGLPTATTEYVNNNPSLGRASVPPVLARLQGELNVNRSFPFTFLPQFYAITGGRISPVNAGMRQAANTYKLNPFQQFNPGLADGSELRAAANSLALPPVWTMPSLSTNLNNPFVLVNQRPYITTINNSDEIARRQSTGIDPPAIQTVGARYRTAGPGLFDSLTTATGSTYAGELKFPLTELAKAFQIVTVQNPNLDTATASFAGATSATGNDHFRYVPDVGTPPNTVKVGDELVERMARLIYDMLESHDEWNTLDAGDNDDDFDGVITGGPSGEAVSRRQQALMWAVNILAFAMPRDTNSTTMRGYIDVVTYKDGSTGLEYVGYGPQPFITEAIAYYDENPGDNLAIAIELFNPNDPAYNATNVDVFALWTPQFGIEIFNKTTNQTLPVIPLGDPGVANFAGRTFGTIVFKKLSTDPNGHFDGIPGQWRVPVDFPIPSAPAADISSGDEIVIRLKKRGWDPVPAGTTQTHAIRWYTVDQVGLAIPDDREADDDGEDEGREPSHDWASVWRDTTPYRSYAGVDATPPIGSSGLGNAPAGSVGLARWNVVMPPLGDTQRTEQHSPNTGPPPTNPTLGNAKHLNDGDGQTEVNPDATAEFIRPTVPLPLMNAGPFGGGTLVQQLNSLPMFGDARVTSGPDLALGDLRPRSFPTTGFLLYVPRYSHVIGATRTFTVSDVLVKAWHRRGNMVAQPGQYPADFGHVPIFDNRQNVQDNSYLSERATKNNQVPWGQLVFDYFTTIDPMAPGVDPLKIPGRININVAPWFVLQNLPMIGPHFGNAVPNFGSWTTWDLPIRRNWVSGTVAPETYDPSPSFWDHQVGVLIGEGNAVEPFVAGRNYQRNLLTDQARNSATGDAQNNAVPSRLPYWNVLARQWQLGPWLAQSAAAYRDGFQILPRDTTSPAYVYADAHLRGGLGEIRNQNQATLLVTAPYRPSVYGPQTGPDAVRGAVNQPAADNSVDAPTEFGFLSIGELANVKGFDGSRPGQLPPIQPAANAADTVLGRSDFMRSVSLLALLDSQYLTTRSNTFTAYVSVMDRAEPEASTRAQFTIDRTNLLPRLEYEYTPGAGSFPPLRVRRLNLVPDSLNLAETAVRSVAGPEARPTIFAEQRVGYFNSRFDD